MRLIFIRHGDPDYVHDSLTEKGEREVKLLTKRVCQWKNITEFYTSPLGRAKATIGPSLKKLKRTDITKKWLEEFSFQAKDPFTGENRIMWDLLPKYYTSVPEFFDKDKWADTDFIKTADGKNHYKDVCDGIDGLLSEYGYIRDGMIYSVENPKDNPNFNPDIKKYQLVSEKNLEEDTTLVLTCHLGVMFTIIAHLTGLSPLQLWQGFYVPPTSVTILNSEERIKGEAFFRVERLGDTRHLGKKEVISSSGYFTDVFQG